MARRESSVATDPALTQKKRARRRLVGAIVLGIAAVIALPLVLDPEPRQAVTDIEISIPSLDEALPPLDRPRSGELAVAPTTSPATAETVVPPVPAESVGEIASEDRQDPTAPLSSSSMPSREAVLEETADSAATDAQTQTSAAGVKQAAKRPARDAVAAGPDTAQRGTDAASGSTGAASNRTLAAKPAGTAIDPVVATVAPAVSAAAAPASGAAGDRFALQIGAYANAGSARAQLDKVRRTGLRAWAETVETSQGQRTRVRAGPYATREQAEQARATLSLAGMESVVVDTR